MPGENAMPGSEQPRSEKLSPEAMCRVAQGLRDTAKRLMARDRGAALALQHRAVELVNMAKEEENRVLRLLERSPPPMRSVGWRTKW